MPRMTRRRLPVVAVVLALVLAAPAGAGDSPLAKRLARALAVPHVSQARTGAVALDLQTGETVFSEHDALPLAPASNEKLAIAYGALVALGSDFRIETDVLGRGEQDGTVWRGSLVLVGHGDPTLSSASLAALARQVRAAGIRKVTRGVFGDESFFDTRRTGAGWKSWFYVNECPPLSALTVDRGRYLGRTSGDPALAAALLFRDALRRAGVAVAGAGHGTQRDDDVPLASVESPPLSRIVAWMDRVSDNFTAELLLKQLGAAGGEVGTSARRRGDRPRGARRRGRAARRRAARRRLRALVARPADGPRALGAPARRLGRPGRPPVPARRAAGRRGQRHALRPDAARLRRAATSTRRPARRASPRRSPATSSGATSSRCCRTAARSRPTGRAAPRTASRRR